MTVRINTSGGIQLAVPPVVTAGPDAKAVSYSSVNGLITGPQIADMFTGTISLWLKIDAGADDEQAQVFTIQTTAPAWRLNIFKNNNAGSNRVRIRGKNTAGTQRLVGEDLTGIVAANGWVHYAFSFDITDAVAGNNTVQVYRQGVDDVGAITRNQGPLDTTIAGGGTSSVGFEEDVSVPLNGCISELWVSDEFIDLSTPANLARFISASKPTTNSGETYPLGTNGELGSPTSTPPEIYLPHEAGASVVVNQGSLGNFTEQGTLTACASSPSD